MSKSTKYIFTACLALVLLAGCENSGGEPEVVQKKDFPEFTATIGEVQSRAYDRNWEQGDEIGISGCGRVNVRYHTIDGNAGFKVKQAGEQIYFQDEEETPFTAYYPWNSLAPGSVSVKADTRKQTEQKGFDFLWGTASGKKGAPEVNLVFSHKMAKVSITVYPGADMSYEEIKTAKLSLKGLSHTGLFNTTDGTTTPDRADDVPFVFADAAAPVFNDEDKKMEYSFIFFPQEFEKPLSFLAEKDVDGYTGISIGAEIDFTSANSKMDGINAKNELVEARQYNLSLTLHKSGMTVGKCEIGRWNDVMGDEINVD